MIDHLGADPGHGGLTEHEGRPAECAAPGCGPSLDELLARLDEQNWEQVAHRVSVETGMDVTAEQVRHLSRESVTRIYQEDRDG